MPVIASREKAKAAKAAKASKKKAGKKAAAALEMPVKVVKKKSATSAFSKSGKLRPAAKFAPLGGSEPKRPAEPPAANRPEAPKPKAKPEKRSYQQEEFFAQWRHQLREPESFFLRPIAPKRKSIKTATPENIFQDWLLLGGLRDPPSYLPPPPPARKPSTKRRLRRQPELEEHCFLLAAEDVADEPIVMPAKKGVKGKGKKKNRKNF